MTALATGDVTITASVREQDIVPASPKQVHMVSVTFGNGTLTYPSGGVPMPNKSFFGFKKQIQLGLLEQASGSGYVHKYDRTNHKIRIYAGGTELTATGGTGDSTPAAVTLKGLFIGE